MKKRIGTLIYNTSTAKPIGEYENNFGKADFKYYYEKLYKKRTGEYFLYGEGNAGSKYAETAFGDQNARTAGEKIIPLTYKQAQSWFEKANNSDPNLATDAVYDHEFGKIKTTDKMIQTSINLHETAYQKLERMSQKQGIPKQKIIENLIMSE